jgi:phosphate-selective porin
MVVRPLAGAADPASSLHLAVAVARSRIEDKLGLRGRTLLEEGVFFDRLYVNGRRLRTGLEAFWEAGPASIAGEYMASPTSVSMGFHLDDLEPVEARAWYVAATWVVTGEKKNGRLEPEWRFGAVEVVGRIEELRFDQVAYPGTIFSFPTASALEANSDLVNTVGVNWHITRFFRVQYNLVLERIADPQRSPAPTNGGRLTTGLLRVQLTI